MAEQWNRPRMHAKGRPHTPRSSDLPTAHAAAKCAKVAMPPAANGCGVGEPAGVLIEVKVAARSSPDGKTHDTWSSAPPGIAAAPYRRNAAAVKPRRLSHVLIFTTDIDAAIDFYGRNLGLRLS